MDIAMIGLDPAQNVFQAHGADGTVVLRKTLRRADLLAFFAGLARPPIGMEACGGAHHRARERAAFGHEVRLMPPTWVEPYVERGRTDGEEDRGRSAAA